VYLNALGPRRDAAPLGFRSGSARVRDGLRTFDALADEVRRRQDALQPSSHSSQPPAQSAGHAALAGVGAALAAYLATPAGQAAVDGFAHAAVGLAAKFFAKGPEQLPLPLA
jgi:hypothetical protein